MSSSTAFSHISSCFSSINLSRRLHLPKRSAMLATFPSSKVTTNIPSSKFTVCAHLDGSGSKTPTSETHPNLRYGIDKSKSGLGAMKSDTVDEEPVVDKVPEQGVAPPKKSAKIHDFCLGIPFGGLVVGEGLTGFHFSRNPLILWIGMVYGIVLLTFSTLSLKLWKQGKSSSPMIFGQAVLATELLLMHVYNYTLTKKAFPSGFCAVVCAAMICFYSYVWLSGGNPPPKKLKVAVNPQS